MAVSNSNVGGNRASRYRSRYRPEHMDRAGSVSRGNSSPGFTLRKRGFRKFEDGSTNARRPTPPGRGEFATGEPRRRWTGQNRGPKGFRLAKRRV